MHLDDPWLAQLLGLLACAIGATAFLQHQDQKLRRHLTLNGVLLAMHFMMLGATVAAINCLLCAVRTWVSGYHRTLSVMWTFIVLACVLVLPQLEHPMQLLTLTGTTLSTYALFRLDGLPLRGCMLASSLCWVVHNLWAGSIGGSLLEGMFFVINGCTMVSLYRHQGVAPLGRVR
ncbi:YgjV family protein [Aeromonas piscicola]|uniref:YgjV family protein n=1 Tax=Aeromonas piscicola TaxID=600645 RepID=UPI0021F86154|nr:YgjV family protein [Aeromonas piscicola]MCW0507105.1 YgjV family protein [Aeromonas piscicola]